MMSSVVGDVLGWTVCWVWRTNGCMCSSKHVDRASNLGYIISKKEVTSRIVSIIVYRNRRIGEDTM